MQAAQRAEVVELRTVQESDLPIFYKHQKDPEAIRMADFPSRELEAFMNHWTRIQKDEANVLRTILCQGQVAGNIVSFERDGKREVGYWLGKEFWGRGVATQALSAFLQVVKVRPLYAHVVKENLASRRVLEKCGFIVIAEVRGFSNLRGVEAEGVHLKYD